MILCLFLISIGVLEFILRQDGKKQRDSADDTPETATAAAPPVTDDLLSLMRAVQGESYSVESQPQRPAAEVAPEPKPAIQ